MKTEEQIEKELQDKGLNAPRLCPADIDVVIVSETFTVLPSGKSMICELTLKNGFTVRGEAACVSKANFNEEIGREISRENARNSIWELEGYLLQEKLRPEPATTTIAIARACHEVNRAYCQAIGDNSQVPWDDAPEWQKESAVLGVELHANNHNAGPQSSHASWMQQKVADGWKYGPIKDVDKKEHPCMVPFSDLPKEQQAKDYIFSAVVLSMLGAQ
jgi:hypothetical protein